MAEQLISGMYLVDSIMCCIDFWGTDMDDVGQIVLSSLHCWSAVLWWFV